MKQNSAPSPVERILAEQPEFPTSPDRRREVEPEPPPKWKNLTLDELYALRDEAKRREGIT